MLRPMVKYGSAGGRGHPVHKTETQVTMLMARRLGPTDGVVLEYIHFHHFQCPTESFTVSRERVPKSNTGKYKERGNSDLKNMSPPDRIEEFPGENLCLRGGKLFCSGCKEILSSKRAFSKTTWLPKNMPQAKRS